MARSNPMYRLTLTRRRYLSIHVRQDRLTIDVLKRDIGRVWQPVLLITVNEAMADALDQTSLNGGRAKRRRVFVLSQDAWRQAPQPCQAR